MHITPIVDQALEVVSLQTSLGCKSDFYQFINNLRSLSNFDSTKPLVSISAICRSIETRSTLTTLFRHCTQMKW